ncbi:MULTISPECIES: glycosyltransferase [unclassified Mucilaginibacter]|uniref:glycosyltransferase n=1 Tax=unclassified Mucilaginibacter TaxID=2617802 RepID=UPI002AC8B1D5|nr:MULTISPECIES: glycosyltransferase [unclassified Mucilaginibacter]MEB0263767.1 glycosyltransferase [Mucilaginibacter sp. 10I4]MEB0278607.1 glycosyltransferase [Mucilaginibacter sp. 10B2]MEB0299317.1 glycosyltransferase [Mucilaginibacter sp. 5C4]WPX23438.1 glycosyltransferase [Mucilaginibacter sp. 5C4]
MSSTAPIALFVYNRPGHTGQTLSYLQKNLQAAESDLFIFSDGAKTDADRIAVEEVRQIAAKATGFRSVQVIAREQNMGLANSIIAGVTQLVNEYGNVIVFEDDLVSSPYTLQYFNDALARYADEEKVMHISAYMFPLQDEALPETFFFRAAFSWGWATWASAWKNFEPDIDKLMAAFDEEEINQFSIQGTMNFWKQMQDFKARKNNSWAIRWYASVFLNEGLTLNPSRSLIHNIGHDGTGVHSNIENMYGVQVAQQPVKYYPEILQENKQAYEAIKYFLKNRKGSLLQRGLRLAKQLMIKSLPLKK